MKTCKTTLFLLLTLCLFGCDETKYGIPFYEDNNVQLAQYMDRYPETYSEFLKVLDKAQMRHTLNAYGTYTLFAPSNEAMEAYYVSKGGSSIDILDEEFCKKLVRYHLLSAVVSSAQFIGGRLPALNYTEDYLIVEFGIGGLNSIYINKESLVSQKDIVVSNGIIHTIEKVMDPIDDGTASIIEANPQFSIFSEALLQTGLNERLDVISYVDDNGFVIKPEYTLFIESDETFRENGINSYEELEAKYSITGSVTDEDNELYQFVAYHCLPGRFYLNDFELDQVMSFNTLSKELVSVEASDEFYINKHQQFDTIHTTVIVDGIPVDTTIIEVTEAYQSFKRLSSNNITKNGVYHELDQLMNVFIPAPVYFKFDFSSYPELAEVRDLDSKTEPLPPSNEIEGMNYKGTMVVANKFSKRSKLNDQNAIQISGEGWWVEFKLPKILKGKYDVLLNTKRTKTSCDVQAFFDGRKLGEPIDLFTKGMYYQQHQYVGSVNLTETEEHTIKFVQTTSGVAIFDYLEFVPIEE